MSVGEYRVFTKMGEKRRATKKVRCLWNEAYQLVHAM